MRGETLPTPKQSLVPFALRIREGYLVGYAMAPEKGAPCAQCILSWLRDRNVQADTASMDTLPRPVHKVLAKLAAAPSPHTFWEVMDNGQQNRLECLVFPHPRCRCHRENYVAPKKLSPHTNFAFSPLFQLKGSRYGTPNGNLWFFQAMGQAPFTMKLVAAEGADPEKEKARLKAVEAWLRKVSLMELGVRLEMGEAFMEEDLRDGQSELIREPKELESPEEIVGAGPEKEAALLSCFHQLAQHRTLDSYSYSGKNPMLVVGSNTWLRQKVPFFLTQQYDLYPLFYPNQSLSWVVGMAAFSRLNTSQPPVFVFASHSEIHTAFDEAICKLLSHCRPMDWRAHQSKQKKANPKISKLNSWWTHWIYRCPKISLKDVLQLEAHPKELSAWKLHLKQQGESLAILNINSFLVPQGIKYFLKLRIGAKDMSRTRVRNVRGIGSFAAQDKQKSGTLLSLLSPTNPN